MPQVSEDTDELNEAVPVCAPSVVVAMTVERLEEVPYANPDCVAFDPPVEPIDPLRDADVWETEDAADVVTDGAVIDASVNVAVMV